MKAKLFINLSFSFYFIKSFLPFINLINETITDTKTIYIYGHINPDSDAILSPIVLADFEKKIGNPNDIIPCRLGEINKETQYALNFFKIKAPILITESELTEANGVYLVDHNSPSQSLDFQKAKIVRLIDHHAITGFETTDPIDIITRPVGCTCTILYQFYKQNNITISKTIAGLIISAIISDTLLLKSPITTQEDINVVKILAEEIGMDYENYGYSMLEAGTDVSDLSESEIINLDSKAYKVNGYMIQIAFVNSMNVDELLYRKKELLNEIDDFISKKHLQLFVLVMVNIIDLDSTILVNGTLANVVKSAFNVNLTNNQAFLPGISSRKKEVYPNIAKIINQLPEYINGFNWANFNIFLLIITLVMLI